MQMRAHARVPHRVGAGANHTRGSLQVGSSYVRSLVWTFVLIHASLNEGIFEISVFTFKLTYANHITISSYML